MYYIERNTISDAMFLAGGVAEPSASETAWVVGTYSVGTEVVRPALHRVFKCAAARTGANTSPPEVDAASWADMRPTNRYLPFGPQVRADGKLVYQNYPLQTTTGDIEYRLAQRYANAVAIFGLRGANWRVRVYDQPGGTLVAERTGRIKAGAKGYWDYAFGQRLVRDRVMVTGLPIYPNAEVVVSIEASPGELRAVSQIEVGKLRCIPGVDFGGVEYGLNRSPKAFTARKTEDNGSTSVLIYGTSYDMTGTVVLSGLREDAALSQLRALVGRGAVFAPTLIDGYQQSVIFGILKSSDVVRDSFNFSSARFQIEGLPT
jgi:hypothetical protein